MLSVSDSEELDADRQVGASAEQPSQSDVFEELLKDSCCGQAQSSVA